MLHTYQFSLFIKVLRFKAEIEAFPKWFCWATFPTRFSDDSGFQSILSAPHYKIQDVSQTSIPLSNIQDLGGTNLARRLFSY